MDNPAYDYDREKPDYAAVRRADPRIGRPLLESLARDLDLVIAFTFLEESPQGTTGAPRNTVAIADRRGEVVHTYAKTHTCAFGDERWCQPGDAFPVTTVDTREGPVAVANYASGPGNGHSVVYSGVAFETSGGQSYSVDHRLVEGDSEARLVWADLDLAALRAYRSAEVWGAAYRRPELHGPLVGRR